MALLRWLLPALVPVGLLVALVRRHATRREGSWMLALTFVLGAASSLVAAFVIGRAAAWTGLDMRVAEAGNRGALQLVFFVVAPIQEAGKVASRVALPSLSRRASAFDGIATAAARRRSALPASRRRWSSVPTPAASGSLAWPPARSRPTSSLRACGGSLSERAKRAKVEASPSSPRPSSPRSSSTASTFISPSVGGPGPCSPTCRSSP